MPKTSTDRLIECQFSNGQRASVLYATDAMSYSQVLSMLGLHSPTANLVVIGGASNMSSESLQRLSAVFEMVLAPLVQELGITVLDGGTDAGVIQMMGQARGIVDGTFNLLGVAPQSKVKLPQEITRESERRKDLEPHHTSFCLIPGENWGSESPWLAQLATTLAGSSPSVTLMINGGKVALADLQANLATGRPAIVLAGSGRMADAIVTAIHNSTSADPAIASIISQYYPHKLSVFDLSSPLANLAKRLRQILSPNGQRTSA